MYLYMIIISSEYVSGLRITVTQSAYLPTDRVGLPFVKLTFFWRPVYERFIQIVSVFTICGGKYPLKVQE